ncbi:MAG: hypothetical protein Q9209_001864 [Squamulea sp. 1 TL-2023]
MYGKNHASREIRKVSTAALFTDNRHRYRYLQGKTSDDDSGKEMGSNTRQAGRSNTLLELRTEKLLLDASLVRLQIAIDKMTNLRLFRNISTEPVAFQEILQGDVMILNDELEHYRDIDPRQTEKKKGDTATMRAKAEIWTTNIELLEGWLNKVLCIDSYQLDCLRRECYGPEYVEGEGLKEL